MAHAADPVWTPFFIAQRIDVFGDSLRVFVPTEARVNPGGCVDDGWVYIDTSISAIRAQ